VTAASNEQFAIQDRVQFYADFPKLNERNHKPTSAATPCDNQSFPFGAYNCFAFVVGDTGKAWWPDGMSFWPNDNGDDTVEELMRVLSIDYSYEECEDDTFEPGAEKVAIFVAKGRPSHIALQPTDAQGLWRSKIGFNIDMEHELRAIESGIYGKAEVFMRKRHG